MILLLLAYADVLKNTALKLYIDNIGVVFSLVRGTSRFGDIGSIAHLFHMLCCGSDVQPWLEHVPTLSNIADGGSRVGIMCEKAQACGIPLSHVVMPNLPQNFLNISVHEWRKWIKESSLELERNCMCIVR